MKVVLFCGGLGTRIREYSESIPKPMIPVGDKPILWHLMDYYSQYGHKEFVLCLGYKANVIKNFFLNYRPQAYADCIVSGAGEKVEVLGDIQADWRVTMIDTGIWRNIGQRLWAVRKQVEDGTKELTEAVKYLASQSDKLREKQPMNEARARMLYEAAWGCRTLAEQEVQAARSKIQQEQWQKRKDDVAKYATPLHQRAFDIAVTQQFVGELVLAARISHQRAHHFRCTGTVLHWHAHGEVTWIICAAVNSLTQNTEPPA